MGEFSLRKWEFLNAGDPGAIDALFAHLADGAEGDLADRFRRYGWMAADLDPLSLKPVMPHPSLAAIAGKSVEAIRLAAAYCGSIGWEFGHVQDPARFEWLAGQAENQSPLPQNKRQQALGLIARAEHFERTLIKRLPMVKTFGLSGSEAFLVAVEQVIEASGKTKVTVGGMHRGRLTQMALLFARPLDRLVSEARGVPDLPEYFGVSSDVPYHLGWQGAREDGVTVWVAPHPSHLSLSAPVAVGFTRGRGEDSLPLMLHTDAAFAGQGSNAELLQLSGLASYAVGGSIHIILNNQIGFTTPETIARTARSCADFGKIVEAPILHVNGNNVDAVLTAATAAARYRETFAADIILNIIGFRRPGHNEVDDPRMTQPGLYEVIDRMPPLSRLYAEQIGIEGPDISGFVADLDAAFGAADTGPSNVPEKPAGLAPDIELKMCSPVATGLLRSRLLDIGEKLTRIPTGFRVHSKVEQFLEKRRRAFTNGVDIDWATGEALALASLADEGHKIRFSGQDTVRGAFSHRHLHLHDQVTGDVHDCLGGFGAAIETFDTPLIENAVLGFEYGFSVASPDSLVVWEAQFGDFLNVCQAVFDQYVTGGEQRWLFSSGLVMLLPHGWDGGGADHSTGHVERILGRCAQANIQLVNVTTPAQYFHVLRRQLKRDFRKPLVILSPKVLLRLPACRSDLSDFYPETGFRTVLDDCAGDPGAVKEVLICSGKVFYALKAERGKRGLDDQFTIVRLEQIYPFPERELAKVLSGYGKATFTWVQEEPENLGAFGWLDRRLETAAGQRVRLVARPEAASPAAGWRAWHDREERELFDAAFEPWPL